MESEEKIKRSDAAQNEMLDAALKYVARGWSVIPVGKDKRPLIDWKRYQTEKADGAQIRQWWKQWPEANVGIVTGSISGIVVVDVEKGGNTSELSPTVIAKTGGGGWHFYYKHPGGTIHNAARIRELTDIRGDGGFVVAPPSLHASGNRYEWSVSPDEADLAELPERVSRDPTAAKTEKKDWPKIAQGVPEGQRNETAASYIGKLVRELPPELWESAGWDAARAWNQRNNPPMNEKELRATFESIAKIELQKRNASTSEWTPPISILELCKKDFPEKKWIVENIFERGTIGQLSAPPNQWKTWLMWYIAICIASGRMVFGKFEVDKQGVLIVNEEDPERMLKERSLMLLGGAEDLPVYIHAEKGIKLESEVVSRLLEEVGEKNVGVVIFDSLSVIHTADENSAKEMGAVFEQMKRFTREGIAVLFTNHHRKKSLKKWEKDDLLEQVRGSTVIGAVISGHITCEEKVQGSDKFIIIRQAKLKGAEKIPPFLVRIKKEGNRIDFVYEGEHEESLDAATKLRNDLYAIIQKTESWLGIQDLKEIIGKSDKPIREQVKALLKEKQIQMKTRAVLVGEGITVPGREKPSQQEFLYFRLGDEEGGEANESSSPAFFDKL